MPGSYAGAVSDDVAVSDGAAPPAPPARPEHPVGAIHPRTGVLLVSAFASLVLVALVALLPVPYAVLTAGPVVNTLSTEKGTPLITVTGRQTYPTDPDGALDLTTVRIFGGPGSKVNLWRLISGWWDGGQAVLPERDVFPTQRTAEQTREENQQEMASSQEAATAAALRELGFTVPVEIGIASVVQDAPAAAVLRAKDVILAVDGAKVANADALRDALQKVTAGQAVPVTVRRDGKEVTVSAVTRASRGKTVLGVTIEPVFVFPFEVKIQIENVGGPSAGTMFALGIIDKLTPGSMTGDHRIAGTGTMDADGQVGPIGGIRQKLIGAREAKAEYFLAPAQNCDEVVGHIPDGLTVIRISTLEQARSAVEQIGAGKGAQGLPGCG